MVKSLEPLVAACAFVLLAACTSIAPQPSPDHLPAAGTPNRASPVELVKSAKAQELAVPCYTFYRDSFGGWGATQPLSINTRDGLVDIHPGRVSVSVAEVLNARCQ